MSMMQQHRTRSEQKRSRRPIRFKGIVRHAHALGVNRSHLFRVLTGERTGPLLGRYRALLRESRRS